MNGSSMRATHEAARTGHQGNKESEAQSALGPGGAPAEPFAQGAASTSIISGSSGSREDGLRDRQGAEYKNEKPCPADDRGTSSAHLQGCACRSGGSVERGAREQDRGGGAVFPFGLGIMLP